MCNRERECKRERRREWEGNEEREFKVESWSDERCARMSIGSTVAHAHTFFHTHTDQCQQEITAEDVKK